MRLLKFFAAIVFVFAIGSSCQKDIDMLVPDNNNIGQILNPAPVTASVNGKIVDENDLPVEGAIVRSGNLTTSTDERGFFRFSNISLDKYASVVTVEKSNYFKGIRTFSAKENSTNYVKVRLIPKVLAGIINSSAGGNVTLSNGSVVTIKENSVVAASGNQSYTGEIKVYASYIDPTLNTVTENIPGSFQAINNNDFRVILKSYGMMAVLLEGQQGELLQIAAGKTAKLKFNIPASLAASAPTSIPLWYLNETDGLWKEDGQATKTGNFYEGDVSHFSFWNCDISNSSIFLQMTFNSSGDPLPYSLVKITRVNNGAYSFGFTDSTGFVGGVVFSNEPLLLELIGNCGNTIYSQNIGPFTQNTDLGNINANISTQNILRISGSASTCNAGPVNNGTAIIYFEGQRFQTPVINGDFSTTITRCGSASSLVEVMVFDFDALQQSQLWSGNVISDTVFIGPVNVCTTTSFQQFINYSINGVSVDYISPPDSIGHFSILGSNLALIMGSNQISDLNFSFNNDGIAAGSFQQLQSFRSSYMDSSGTQTTIPVPIMVNIIEYGNVGEFIGGNFSGVVQSTPTTTYDINCTFRIRRQF